MIADDHQNIRGLCPRTQPPDCICLSASDDALGHHGEKNVGFVSLRRAFRGDDGGQSLRVCPAHPHQVLQTSEMELALKETQTRFYALDLSNPPTEFLKDDAFNLLKLRVNQAEPDGTLQYIASTYDPYDQVIRDGIYRQDLLSSLPAIAETKHVRVVHFEQPLTIKVDGMKKEGVIMCE